jgi:peroxiredoxin family protein/TusA-related sulfurtransferase
VGLRGYLATRILDQHGFKTRNLTGGYKTFKAATGLSPKDKPMTGEITDDTGEHSSQSDTRNDEDDSGLPAAEPKLIDARALQCPGPILRLKSEIDGVEPGSAVAILASDPGFPSDVQAWCHSTGHSLQKLQPEDGAFRAVVTKAKPTSQPSPSPQTQAQPGQKLKSIVVFSGDFDKAVASFIIANGAAAMGSQVTLFFTFWGLNILRRNRKVKVRKTLLEKMFGWMMPRGARKLKLSKMNMAGAGTAMIKGIMNKKNVPSLEELIDSARTAGVKLVACNMTMDLMGIKPEELIDGVEQGGVAMYLDTAEQGNVNLFI